MAIQRRQIIRAAAAATAAAAAFPGFAQARAKVKVGYLHTPAVDGQIWIGQELGSFAKNGLDLELVRFTTGLEIFQAMTTSPVPRLRARRRQELVERADNTVVQVRRAASDIEQGRDAVLARAAAAAGVPDATPYTLRHSFCSLLLHEGRSVIYVARQLGHEQYRRRHRRQPG